MSAEQVKLQANLIDGTPITEGGKFRLPQHNPVTTIGDIDTTRFCSSTTGTGHIRNVGIMEPEKVALVICNSCFYTSY